MSPGEFWNSSLPDCILFIKGYENRLNDQWIQTREIVYMIYCGATESKGRENIFDFMPLPGDPTKKELQEIRANQLKKKVEGTNARVKRLIERGIIKKSGVKSQEPGKKK